MNKNLLLGIAMVIGGIATAQNSSSVPSAVGPIKIDPAIARLAIPYQKNQQLGANSFESMVNGLQTNVHQSVPKFYSCERIGTTQYQLQTNSSICNRIVRNPDGTIGATWTMSQSTASGWPDRGTGYTYYDGSNWSFGTAPWNSSSAVGPVTSVESVRTGFTNLGVTNSGAEVIICHETAVSTIHMDSRATKGTGAWTSVAISGLPDTWARLAVGGANGHTLHVISSSGTGGGTAMINNHGQTGSINYSRSLDGGVTWDILRYIIPAIDSSNYLGFGGDSYSIEAKGDTIAIVAGGFDVDVVLLKSVNNGDTWTKTIVKRFPIPMFDAATMYTDTLDPTSANEIDTLETNDASVEVMLDNQGMAHVWYGRMRVLCSTPGTATGQGMNYFPGTDGLMYWNENMGNSAPVRITNVLDLNFPGHPADGILNIYVDPTGATLGFGTYQTSLTSFPSAGIDPSGKIYLSYSGLFEGVNNQGDVVPSSLTLAGKSFRHTYLMRSDDGGISWSAPLDVTDPNLSPGFDWHESVYGAIPSKLSSSFVDLIVQDDASPGHGVSTGTSPDPQGPGVAADILYYKIASNLIYDVGVHDQAAISTEMNLFPNPATNSVTLKFNVSRAAKATVKIYNAIGQEVSNIDNQSVVNGTCLNFNLTNYQRGIYFVNASIDGKTYSQKLVIE
ncbi:MAG: T9SS type A sorting domain-containing protein [Bacteroidota bacterium]